MQDHDSEVQTEAILGEAVGGLSTGSSLIAGALGLSTTTADQATAQASDFNRKDLPKLSDGLTDRDSAVSGGELDPVKDDWQGPWESDPGGVDAGVGESDLDVLEISEAMEGL